MAKQLVNTEGVARAGGAYSPCLRAGGFIFVAGQGPMDPATGKIAGDTIEEQTKVTLENSRTQLATAGCTFADVFKVNVYLTDLAEWPRFNAVYREWLPEPRPVRTAVQAGLLMNLKVEIEMWAVKK